MCGGLFLVDREEDMNDPRSEGRLQADAGLSLLRQPHLVKCDVKSEQLIIVDQEYFRSNSEKVDPQFGRLICWLLFSTGAEFLAKGVCLARDIEIRKPKDVLARPTAPLQDWIDHLDTAPRRKAMNFGTLGDLTEKAGYLDQLCKVVSATPTDRNTVLAAYTFLQKSVRNRDAHAYVQNVREAQFGLVQELFVRSFNLLLSWRPRNPIGSPTDPM